MLIVLDNFIKDRSLIEAINKDPRWDNRKFPSSYFKIDEAPACALEKLVREIWVGGNNSNSNEFMNIPPLLLKGRRIDGLEYWGWQVVAMDSEANLEGHGDNIDIHVDHDEASFLKGNGEGGLSPFISVYYPYVSDDLEGGNLQLFMDKPYGTPGFVWDGKDISVLGKATEIECKANRLIIADGAYYHGVTQVSRGMRRSLNCNQWRSKTTFDYDDLLD